MSEDQKRTIRPEDFGVVYDEVATAQTEPEKLERSQPCGTLESTWLVEEVSHPVRNTKK